METMLHNKYLDSCLLLIFSVGIIFVTLPYVTADTVGVMHPNSNNNGANVGPAGDGAGGKLGGGLPKNYKDDKFIVNAHQPPANQELNQNQGKLPKKHYKAGVMRLAETPECGEEAQRYCSEKVNNANNLHILDCLQDDENTANKLSTECQHFLWQYKFDLTHNDGFDKASNKDCAAELDKFPECKAFKLGDGKRIPCLIENLDDIDSENCQNFLTKMAAVVFSDYRFMDFFMKDCFNDITTLKCGRLPQETDDDSPHLQGSVIACLNEKRKNLGKKCKKSLLRVAELQSDDFHLDRPLYYACKDDREAFCSNVVAGDGAVFNCLYKELGNPKLSEDCRAKLEARQELVAEDVKVDKTFYDACKADIKKHRCAGTNTMDDDDMETDLGRSRILICLENVQNNASVPGKKVHAECLQQMFELRSQLMQDYKISPELVKACQHEIDDFCDGLEEGGNTIQCLMSSAVDKQNEKSFGHECKAQVKQLLHVAKPFENIVLDQPLMRACGDVVNSACQRLPRGEGNIVNCLLENLDHEDMTDECEDRLLEIQYFAVRDFKLDHRLFQACQADATELCHMEPEDLKHLTAENGPLTFACLHRHMTSDDDTDKKPSKQCAHEIRRVLRERSNRIALMPEVEAVCMKDLSDLCSEDDEQLKKGGEMDCLQTKLDELSDECKEEVSKFTVEQNQYLDMDRILMKACTPMMKEFCEDIMEKSAIASEVLDCLIEHKNHISMDAKCAVGIEHHQLISLKDFRFNHKFREACQESVNEVCKGKKTKFAVVACLSEHVRNDTLMDQQQRVTRPCRKQLRFELLQRGENIKLDPDLQKSCDLDVKKFCKNVKPGNAEVIECLKEHQKMLTSKCHKMIFQREEVAAVVGDYTLLHTCKKMIRKVCKMDMSEEEIYDCLKEHKDEMDFDESCRKLVLKRQVEKSHDFRLNPHIQKKCRLDIAKFCGNIYDQENIPEMELEGKVINCLKKKFISKTKSLSRDCEIEIKSLVKEAALDINQNPVLLKVCKQDIKKLCLNEVRNVRVMTIDEGGPIQSSGEGAVMECLKRNVKLLKDEECRKEVSFAISESRIDINVDPLLHSTCQKDLITLCSQMAQGQGRQMACLLSHLETSPERITPGCKVMLDRRKSLWEYAAEVAPLESLSELYDQVAVSPSRNYFMAVIFTVIGVIFIVGISCGRITKRVRAEVKNK